MHPILTQADTASDPEDARWMQCALKQAHLGLGATSPNPPVGAVLVRHGQLLGEGYHHAAGQPHAERMAMAHARSQGHSLKGATLYVTLEPCSSYGRTPPCTKAIIESGISRVVYGSVDPDKRHQGRANEVLRAAGIQVQSGVEKAACDLLLRPWAYAVTHHRPWVVAKVATTLDGRLTRCRERWLSSPDALRYAHQLRRESDAILTGGETVRRDNPSLTIRTPMEPVPAEKKQPWRVIVTRHAASLPQESHVLTDDFRDRTLIREQVNDWHGLLTSLYEKQGVVQLMLECGGALLRIWLEQGLIQEWVQNVTPYLAGGSAALVPGDFLPREQELFGMSVTMLEHDLIIRGTLSSS